VRVSNSAVERRFGAFGFRAGSDSATNAKLAICAATGPNGKRDLSSTSG